MCICCSPITKTGKLIVLSILIVAPCRAESFRTVKPLDSVADFDDVRGKDLRTIDVAQLRKCIGTLTFNEHTVWPEDIEPLAERLILDAMVPPLGARKLHQEGITGQGVNVAIIDQPLLPDHPEFNGKIVACHDTGCDGPRTSMHGPAVASLLVGDKCGTALAAL